jgi:hypothetical protein
MTSDCWNFSCLDRNDYAPWAIARVGVAYFGPLLTALELLFVAYYIDVWKTYWQNSTRGRVSRTVLTSGSRLLRIFTNHLQDKVLLFSTIVQSLLVFLYVATTIASNTLFLPLKQDIPYDLAITLLMILLLVAGLVMLRKRVVVERTLGPLEILLVMTLPGALCDKIFKIYIAFYNMGFQLGMFLDWLFLADEVLWMIQSVLQVSLILYALKREGRYARTCCGTSPLSHVLDTLVILNLGIAVYDITEQYYYQYYLNTNTESILKVGAWIFAVTTPLVVLFNILSGILFIFIRSKHSRIISELRRQQYMQGQVQHS